MFVVVMTGQLFDHCNALDEECYVRVQGVITKQCYVVPDDHNAMDYWYGFPISAYEQRAVCLPTTLCKGAIAWLS